jgi:hypothetical protein
MKKNSPHPPRRRAELPLLRQLTLQQTTAERKALLVLRLLRSTAIEYRTDHMQPFYPVRAAAEHFGLSPATIERLYQQLCSERLLRLVWGAQTRLEALPRPERRRPRSIAIPVDLPRFSSSADYRFAIVDLQRELWSGRVAERLIFFRNSPEEVLHLCHRYHFHSIDTVIWLLPENVAPPVFTKLSTLGLRLICIAANPVFGARECHIISPRCGISKLVREKILKV